MEKRSHERLPASLQARLFYGSVIYTGTVTDLSEQGMFISTRVNFPPDIIFEIAVLLNERSVRLPVRVVRRVKVLSRDIFPGESGVGVCLLNPPGNYLEFVRSCRATEGKQSD